MQRSPSAKAADGAAAKAAASIPNWAGSASSKAKVQPWSATSPGKRRCLPSYAVARAELLERGLKLNIKEVHNISVHAGQAAITLRRRELELFRQGKLPAADGKGKRFGAMIDGGRVKLRKTTRRQKGRGKTKTQKRRFKTVWREVKQIIVFEMDEQGRMKKGTQPIFDGTFQGPNEVMEVLAMRLHQVGAAQAEVVAFRCDGAPWIWDRLAWVQQRLRIE